MSSLESGSVDTRSQGQRCRFRAKIKPRQACNCHIERRHGHRNGTGGIYDI